MIGSVLSTRYELVKELDQAPMFRLYKAKDRVAGRDVMVRVFDEPFASEDTFLVAVEDVVRRSISLPHPNLERMLEMHRDNGVSFLVSEFSPGVALQDRMALLAPFSPGVALSIISELCLGLMMLHESGITHGDISSRTVMIGPDNRVRLTLGGLWTSFSHSRSAGAVVLLQMAPYMAPDITRGEMPSPSSDMYAIGVLLFELLTGKRPFHGETAMAYGVEHATQPIPSAHELNQGVPVVLDEVLRKLLAKTKPERYPDVRSLLSDIRVIQDALRFGQPLTWPLPSPTEAKQPKQAVTEFVAPTNTPRNRMDIPPATSTGPKVDMGTTSRPQPKAEDAGLVAPRMGAAREPKKSAPTVEVSDQVPVWLRALAYLIFITLSVLVGAYIYWNLTKPKEILMPNIVFKSGNDAKKLLNGLHLKMRVVVSRRDPKIAEGTILETNPTFGQPIKEGGIVDVTVSAGTGFVEVPDLKGMTVDEATTKLGLYGLKLRVPVRREFNDKFKQGAIIEQKPTAGMQVEASSGKVTVVVSRGSYSAAAEGRAPDGKKASYKIELTMPAGIRSTQVVIVVRDTRGETEVFSDTLSGDSPPKTIDVDAYGDEPEYLIYYDGELMDTRPLEATN